MPNLDPVTTEWIVAIVKMYYDMLANLCNQKDATDEEIASLARRIMEDKTKLNEENACAKAQERMIVTQRDLINSLRGDLAACEEEEAKRAGVFRAPRRANGTNLLDNVVPVSVSEPSTSSNSVAQGVGSEPAKEYMDGDQVDSEQTGVHDCDSCFLCMEEARRDSP